METPEITLARHGDRIERLEKCVDDIMGDLKDIVELNVGLRVELGKLQAQNKITWVLMLLVISGLVSVAFAFWGGKGIP